jgi:tetratricopeptide (TPR) repeat protein
VTISRRLELAEIADEAATLALLIEDTDRGLVTFGRYGSVAEREAGVQALRERLTVPLVELTLLADRSNPFELLAPIVNDQRRCVSFYDLETALPEVAGILNLQRERLLGIPHALVFWVTEHGLRQIATLAPDFWAWRSGVFDFRLGSRELEAQIASDAVLQPLDFKDRGELERRVSLYRGLVQERASQSPADRRGLVRALIRLAQAEQLLGNRDSAESAARRAVELARSANDAAALVPAHFQLGRLVEDSGRLAEAEALFEHALVLAESIGDRHNQAVLQQELGTIAHQRQDLDRAELLYQRARDVYETEGAERDMASVYHQLGNLALARDELEQAERSFQQALEVQRRIGQPRDRAIELHGLGSVALQRGDYDSSGGYLGEARDIYESLGLEQETAATYHQLGRLAQETGRLADARNWFERALEIAERLGLGRERAAALHQLGRVAQERGDLESAERWLRRALTAGEQVGSSVYATNALAQLGVVLWNRAKQEDAVETAGRAYLLARDHQLLVVDSIRRNLAEMATELGLARFRGIWARAFDGQQPPGDLVSGDPR